MALSTTETVGFLEQLKQLMRNSKETLQSGGLDVTNWITDMDETAEGCLVKDGEKDALRAASKAKTKDSDTTNKAAYKKGSTRLDAIIGVLGKDTTEGKQAARLRSSLNKKQKSDTNNQNNT